MSIKNIKKIILGLVILTIYVLLIVRLNYSFTNDKPISGVPIINPFENSFTTHSKKSETTTINKEKLYNDCLKKKFSNSDISPSIKILMDDIDSTIKNNNYNVSILYEDINIGYTYSYDANKVFYGCSVVKIVDALYLINEAANNKIDLDTESVTYTKKFEKDYSKGLKDVEFGTKVSLRDLIRYDISVSDNSAHFMLVNYIGKNNLKKYAQELGAKQIFSKDLYGNQTATDTNIYLKEAYRIINEDKIYGPLRYYG